MLHHLPFKLLLRLLPAIFLIVLVSAVGHAATLTAASCAQSDVLAKINLANDGDTVVMPACPGGVAWTTELDINKAITLKGADCVLDGNGRPTSCPTVIVDSGADGGYIMVWTLVPNKVSRMTNIEFRDGGTRTFAWPSMIVSGQTGGGPQDSRRFRFDHNRFIQLNGYSPWVYDAWGLIDHNVYDLQFLGIYQYAPSEYDYADARWAEEPTAWGSDRFLFVENNTFTRPNLGTGACAPLNCHAGFIDAYAGARYVIRFNDIARGWVEAHGTESPGRARGTRAVEVYKNRYTGNNTGNTVVNIRSGPVQTWGNSVTGYMGAAAATHLNNEGTLGSYDNWIIADGTRAWDFNDPGNPQATYTVSAATPSTITVAGANWTVNQWASYDIHKVGCTDNGFSICAGLVLSNTTNTITFMLISDLFHLNLSIGDQIRLNLIKHVLDAPCRSGGSLLVAKSVTSLTRSAGIATATVPGHGYSTGDIISIAAASDSIYEGDFAITVLDANRFTFQLPAASGATSATNAVATKVPWTPGANNQITDPCYQWLNKEDSTNLKFDTRFYGAEIRPNEHYFDYDPSLTFDGSIAANRSSVGVGPVANRPSTCATNAAYWATDEGNWDTTSSSPSGRLYRCTATNTWALYYTPYTYPHPLQGPIGPPTITTQPANQTVSLGQTATFSIVATGNPAPTYQWRKNGTSIGGATSSSYTTPAAVPADNGAVFDVVVTNPSGSVTSTTATLTVNTSTAPPVITTQPANRTAAPGQTATFSVVATGNPLPTYQWRKNGTNVAGATSTSYTTPPAVPGDNGARFDVVVSNTAGSVTSNAATLTVASGSSAPTITTQPSNETVTAGQTATFSLVATGNPLPTYQWRKNGTNITGATSSSYTTPPTAAPDNGAAFDAVVTNAAGSVTSNAGTLTVNSTSGSTYRAAVTITNPGGTALTDFQVNIRLSSTFNFSAAQSNGADLRVTNSDGITPIPFWIENWNAPTSASIWARVPSIPASGTTIYLYYGNSSAASASNGTATFQFFDDFSYSIPAASFVNKALAWVIRAQDATGSGGVSSSYATDTLLWIGQDFSATGYTIPTLYDAATAVSDPNFAASLRTRAGQMADSEVASQYADGSWGYVFDTGQAIEGLVRAYNETGNVQYLNSAVRAGDWLVANQAVDGSWGNEVGGFAKAYHARVARSMLMLWQATQTPAYNTAAVANLNWDVAQQQANGWFQNLGVNSTVENAAPLTNAIAYTIEGLLDSGLILNNSTYINAAKLAADVLLTTQLRNGTLLGGTYLSDWTPGTQQQCVTGDAQTALVWLKLYQYTVNQGAPNVQYLKAAHKLNQYLAGVQGNSSDPGVDGGLAGSDPLPGFFQANQILSWTTKFFLDGLLLEAKLSGGPVQFYALDPGKWSMPSGPGGFFNTGVLQYAGTESGFGPIALAMNGNAGVPFTNGIIEYSVQGNAGFDELALVYRGQNLANSYAFYPSTWQAQNNWLSEILVNTTDTRLGVGGAFSAGASYVIKAAINGSSHAFSINNVQVLTTADSSLVSGSVGLLAWGNTSNSVGYFRIRQYAATDPVTSVGTPQLTGNGIASLTLNPSSIAGGSSITGTVILNVSTGGTVTLSSSIPAVASTPASVQVPSGSTSANFTVTTFATSSLSQVVISASFASSTKQANLVVTPGVSSVALNPTSTVGGNASTGTVTLTGAAPSGGAVISLSSNNTAAATVATSVTIPAGSTSITFPVNTSGVASPQSASISASYNGSSKSGVLNVTPAAIFSLTLSPTSVPGGTSSTATVSLNGIAPAGGAVIGLNSSNAAAVVPASVAISAGARQATFQVTTSNVTVSTSATITATYNGQSSNGSLQIVTTSAWYNAEWAYRRAVTVSNTTASPLTSFQVHVVLDSSFSFTKAQSNGADIRFTTSDGVTLIPYWIEYWNLGTQASIWVRIPSIPSGGTSIFMYYGNPSAGSTSDGNGTFNFFDDFSYTSGGLPAIDPSKWSFPAGQSGFYNIGGALQYNAARGVGPRALAMQNGATVKFGNGIIEYNLQGNGRYNELGLVYRGQNPETSSSYIFYPSTWSSQNKWFLSDIAATLGRGGSFAQGNWYAVQAAINGSSHTLSVNGVPVIRVTASHFTSGTVGLMAWGNANVIVKNFRIRQYAPTDPATSVGPETVP